MQDQTFSNGSQLLDVSMQIKGGGRDAQPWYKLMRRALVIWLLTHPKHDRVWGGDICTGEAEAEGIFVCQFQSICLRAVVCGFIEKSLIRSKD